MSFSAALSIGSKVFGAIQAGRAQAATAAASMHAQAVQERLANKQLDLQNFNLLMGQDRDRLRREENEYQRKMNAMNRRITEGERRFDEKQVEEFKRRLMAERQYTIQRQIKEDVAAAKQREFMLNQIINNQNIAQEEREFAKNELANVKAIASGERNEDLKRFYEERAQAEIEREFATRQYEINRTDRLRERAFAENQRGRTVNEIDEMVAHLQAINDQFTDPDDMLAKLEEFSPADIDAEIDSRTEAAFSDVDRAGRLVASKNEADLIRKGMDESTAATDARSEIARRLADQYSNARVGARDSALKYLAGRQDMNKAGIANRMGLRSDLLSQAASPYDKALNALLGMRDLPTAASSDYNQLRSGVYSRGLTSAGDFRAPVRMGSGIYDQLTGRLGTGLAKYLAPGSAASKAGIGLRTGVFSPYKSNLESSNSLYQNAGTIGNNVMDQNRHLINMHNKNAIDAGKSYGSYINDISQGVGGWLDRMWDNNYHSDFQYEPGRNDPNFWDF